MRTPALSRASVDRATHRRKDADWLDAAWPAARVLVVDADGRALVADGRVPVADGRVPVADGRVPVADGHVVDADGGPAAERPRLVWTDATGPRDEAVFLGADAGVAWFAVRGSLPERPGATPRSLREVGAELGDADAGLLVTAVAMLNWHDTHGFDPVTGAPTTAGDGGWSRTTPADRQTWPRTDDAIIVLISDGVAGPDGRCLLGRQSTWPPGRYSCLAGFVEPGESLEAAVAREVAEEAGVHVTDIAYVASQPWPFPASLMIGFTARADPAQPIVRVDEELQDARWFSRAGLRAGDAGLPPPASIAHHLITLWLDGD